MDPQLVYLLLVLAALIVLNWRFFQDRLGGGAARRACRWRLKSKATEDHPAVWKCTVCGVDAGTRDGKKPTRCLSAARDY